MPELAKAISGRAFFGFKAYRFIDALKTFQRGSKGMPQISRDHMDNRCSGEFLASVYLYMSLLFPSENG